VDIPQLSESIGLGPTLLLYTTKAYAWLFFVLTILSLPTMAFYHQGSESDIAGVLAFFSKITLGNIGRDDTACGYGDPSKQEHMTLQCPFGIMNSLYGFGLTKEDTSKCSADPNDKSFMDAACNNDVDLFQDLKKETMNKLFNETCRGQRGCKIPIRRFYDDRESKNDYISVGCYDSIADRIKSREKSVFVITAACVSGSVTLKQLGVEFAKERVALLVVGLDFLVILSVLIFLKIIKLRQKEFIQDFK